MNWAILSKKNFILKNVTFFYIPLERTLFVYHKSPIYQPLVKSKIRPKTPLFWRTNYIIDEILSFSGATLYKNPSYQTVSSFLIEIADETSTTEYCLAK